MSEHYGADEWDEISEADKQTLERVQETLPIEDLEALERIVEARINRAAPPGEGIEWLRSKDIDRLQAAEVRCRELEGEVADLEGAQVFNRNAIRLQRERADRLTLAAQAAREALEAVKLWASKKCPCENEEPNPCPLCGASVENLEACKAIRETLPPKVADPMDNALASLASVLDGGPDGISP